MRHHMEALRVHWELCRKYGLECTDHQLLPVTENGERRIIWDITTFTNKRLKPNRPNITVVQKDTQEWTLIDIAVLAD